MISCSLCCVNSVDISQVKYSRHCVYCYLDILLCFGVFCRVLAAADSDNVGIIKYGTACFQNVMFCQSYNVVL